MRMTRPRGTAYGRYWGALEQVHCLHFEACYYQPLAWCIAQGYRRFEGGAQGEHKIARGLLPVATHSAHWLAHPRFAAAVERFLAREGTGVDALPRRTATSATRSEPRPATPERSAWALGVPVVGHRRRRFPAARLRAFPARTLTHLPASRSL